MTRVETYKILDEVFQEVFDNEGIHVSDNTTAKDVDGWDSLEHINLVVAIENKFNIEFNTSEINQFRNVGEMVDTILKRLGE